MILILSVLEARPPLPAVLPPPLHNCLRPRRSRRRGLPSLHQALLVPDGRDGGLAVEADGGEVDPQGEGDGGEEEAVRARARQEPRHGDRRAGASPLAMAMAITWMRWGRQYSREDLQMSVKVHREGNPYRKNSQIAFG